MVEGEKSVHLSEEKTVAEKSAYQHLMDIGAIGSVLGLLKVLPEKIIDDYYTHGFYRIWALAASKVSDTIPFSAVETLICATSGLALYASGKIVYDGLKPGRNDSKKGDKRSKGMAERLKKAALSFTKIVGVGAIAIYALGHLNVNRSKIPVNSNPSYDISIVDSLERRINSSHVNTEVHFDEINDALNSAMDSAYIRMYGVNMPCARKIKQFSLLPFNVDSVGGFTVPQVQEVIINKSVSDYEKIFVMAHEKAHLRGFIDESEASLFAFISCIESGNKLLQYSALCYLKDLEIIIRYSTLGTSSPELLNKILKLKGQGGIREAYVTDTFWKLWSWYQEHGQGKVYK